MAIVKIFYDTETTGVNPARHCIHQLSGFVEVDGEVVETFDYRIRPHDKAEVVPEALMVGGVTEEQIRKYPEAKEAYRAFTSMLGKYINKYEQRDKAWLVGFNNRAFDDNFLRAFFEQNKDSYFGSWFWSDSLDVMVLSAQYLLSRRASMPSFKLKRVALELGLEIDEKMLHNSLYDVEITRKIYKIVTGEELEL